MKRKFSLEYLPAAIQDLEDIFDYISKDSSGRAKQFVQSIDKKLGHLEFFPYFGSVPKDRYLAQKGYRLIVIQDYLALYRIKNNTILIYRVVHGKRRYQFLLG